MTWIRTVPRVLWSSLVGSACPGCGARLSGESLCPDCFVQLAALPSAPNAVFLDAGLAARLVRLGKRGQWRAAARVFARVTAIRHAWGVTPLPMVDLVTWVPHDTERAAVRGGHLPERFARALARELGVPARSMLRRRRGRPQRGLSRAERQRNVREAFFLRRGRCSPRVHGMHVLLVDDVRTTGATFEAASATIPYDVARITPLAIVGVEPAKPRSERGISVHERTRACR